MDYDFSGCWRAEINRGTANYRLQSHSDSYTNDALLEAGVFLFDRGTISS
jgi:hypothetical protein